MTNIVSFDPEEMNKPRFSFFDRAGSWGPGCDHEADCTITGYEWPSGEDPPFDVKEKKEAAGKQYNGPYVRFFLEAVRDGEKTITDRWYLEQNQALITLTAIGVHVDDDGSHDADQVVGMKVIINTGDPKKNRETGHDAYSSIRSLQSCG